MCVMMAATSGAVDTEEWPFVLPTKDWTVYTKKKHLCAYVVFRVGSCGYIPTLKKKNELVVDHCKKILRMKKRATKARTPKH